MTWKTRCGVHMFRSTGDSKKDQDMGDTCAEIYRRLEKMETKSNTAEFEDYSQELVNLRILYAWLFSLRNNTSQHSGG